jgi:hypothetical protein
LDQQHEDGGGSKGQNPPTPGRKGAAAKAASLRYRHAVQWSCRTNNLEAKKKAILFPKAAARGPTFSVLPATSKKQEVTAMPTPGSTVSSA